MSYWPLLWSGDCARFQPRGRNRLRLGCRALLGPPDRALVLLRGGTLLWLRDGALLRVSSGPLLRVYHDGPLLRLAAAALLRLGRCPLCRTTRATQLFDTPAIALLDTSVIGAATAPLDDPSVLRLVETVPPGTRLPEILPGVGGVQLFVEAPETRIAADQLFVRGRGVATIEALRVRRRGRAKHSPA